MKSLLLIAYYFPPSGGAAVQRWLGLTKYLTQKDWNVTVITTQDGDYPYIDDSLLNKIHPDIKIIRTKTPTFGRLYKSLLGKDKPLPYGSLKTDRKDSFIKRLIYFLRLQFINPDMRVIWNKWAYKSAKNELLENTYDVMITTGPPHSTHLVGLKIKKRFNVKWIADFQDPWSKIYYLENEKRNPLIKYFDRLHESKVLSMADKTVTVSENFSNYLTKGNKHIIPNAFDSDDFIGFEYKPSDHFRIKFVGALTESRKDDVLKILSWIDVYATQNEISNIEFTLIGAYQETPDDISKSLISVKFTNIPFIPHKKVLKHIVDSEVLLLVINQALNNEGILTYKLYEYIGSRTFILGTGPMSSEAKEILQQYQAGKLFEYNEREQFIDSFDEIYRKWQKGECIKNKGDIYDFTFDKICCDYEKLMLL